MYVKLIEKYVKLVAFKETDGLTLQKLFYFVKDNFYKK